ncbi:MAG TPA: hypothetical protein VIJ47_08360 [Acidimicrobiales bacterium]
MNNASFLLVAIGFSVVVSLAIWAFSRKPKTFMSSIDDFEREMRALGRDPDATGGGRTRGSSVQPRGASDVDDTTDPSVAPEEPRP